MKTMKENVSLFVLIPLILLQLVKVDSAKCLFSPPSTIQCADAQISESVQEINQITSLHYLSHLTKLTLLRTQFENNQIQRGWLNKITVTVSGLTIENTNLSTIESGSFSGSPFQSLTGLVLTNTQIDALRSNIFEDSKLISVTVTFSTFHPLTVEENIFASLPTIRSLSFQKCITPDGILNITGPNAEVPSLIQLVLSYNDIPELPANSFVGVKNLKVLYLAGSQIKNIEQGAFDPPMLERLDISVNNLTTLPKNLFRYVRGGISIHNNKWHCDCDLVWLRDMFHYYPYYFSHRTFYCTTPEGNVSYEDVDFCPS